MSTLASRIRAANRVLLGEGNLAAIPEFFAADYVAHGTVRDLEGGHAAVQKFLRALRRAFPEIEVEVESLVERNDRVAWQRTLRGVQSGPYQGFPATGRLVVWRDMVTSRFRDGLIAEDWSITDLAERLLRARKT